jgi:NitT/TauT family transport system permease protein
MARLLRGALLPVLFLLFWEFAAKSGWLVYDSLSWPSAILVAGIGALQDGSLLLATWQTCQAALLGLFIGSSIGVLLGSILGLWSFMARMAGPTFDALRAIPSIALMPLFLLMMGWGLSMEASVVAYACTWPVLIATWAAVRGVEPRLLEVADVLEMQFGERLRKIVLATGIVTTIAGNGVSCTGSTAGWPTVFCRCPGSVNDRRGSSGPWRSSRC